MKKIISVFIILVLALFTACSSDSGKILAFNLLADDTYEISISVDPLQVKGKVSIPSKYKGKAVTKIADGAFEGCKNLSAITIPETINCIGNGSFSNTGVWNESKANSVVYIGNWAVGYKGEYDTLTSLTIEPGTIGIAKDAFSVQIRLESVIIPDSVTVIGDGAFAACDKLKSIIIPMNVTIMGKSVFTGCPSSLGEEMQTIYAAAPSKPVGWHDNWMEDREATVVWGYRG